MDVVHGASRYWSIFFEDSVAGCGGLRLNREFGGATSVVAECVFWDGSGGFYIKTLGSDIPVEIATALIEETKRVVKVR